MKRILLILILSLNASAFTLNNNSNLAFTKDEVAINFASGFCSNIGISDSEMMSIIDDAVSDYWNKAPTARLKLRAGSLSAVSTNFKTGLICNSTTNGCDVNTALSVSGGILISCNTNSSNFSNSTSVLAVTVPNNTTSTAINGSLIILNDLSPNNKFATKSRDEVVAIIAHEIGHAIGLGHSPIANALMYYSVVPNRRSLSQDDIDGITYLYPKKQPISCGSIVDIAQKTKGPKWPSYLISLLFGMILSYFLIKLRPRLAHSVS